MQRTTGGASLGSFVARGIPLTTTTSSSAYVIGAETMRDLPAGSHPYLTSDSPEDHTDLRTGSRRPGKRGSGTKERGGVGLGAKGGGGALDSDPPSTQYPHWCLQSLHTSSELVANGDMPLPCNDLTSDSSSRPQKDLSRIYFPWTLTASSASGSRLPPATSVVDPGSYVRYINTGGQGQQRSRPGGHHRCRRSGSGLSSPSSASNSSVDRIRPSSQDDSRPGSHQKVLLSSPFESTLTQLRLDRLRIEEEHLLEIKRQEELDRIRGPQPKWYAMKTSQFGRELKRNNDLLKTREGGQQDQVDYRATLERASQHFQQAYYSEGQ